MARYAIYFNGYYPVGAVAVVSAYNEECAISSFLEKLNEEEPYLVESNKLPYLKVELLDCRQPCHILLNGNY